MKTKAIRLTPFLALAMGVLLSAAASGQMIDFDDVKSGTVINDNYDGVTFSCPGCDGGNDVLARQPSDFTPVSEPNVVSPDDAEDGCWNQESIGFVRATFDMPTSAVSIRALTDDDDESGNPDQGVLRAYNAADELLDEDFSVVWENPTPGEWDILFVSGADISYVEFAGIQSGWSTCFDDLAWGEAAPAMPLPALIALLVALATIGALALRRRSTTAV